MKVLRSLGLASAALSASVLTAATYTVTNTADSGAGSLRLDGSGRASSSRDSGRTVAALAGASSKEKIPSPVRLSR